MLGEKSISPSRFQSPFANAERLQMVCASPPAMLILFKPESELKASCLLSGDQNTVTPVLLSVSANGFKDGEFNGRKKIVLLLASKAAGMATYSPSGETTGLPRKN